MIFGKVVCLSLGSLVGDPATLFFHLLDATQRLPAL